MAKPKDFTGQRFGNLVAVKRIRKGYTSPSGKEATAYLCKCDCGKEKVALSYSLSSGGTKSCGCRLGWKMKPHQSTYNTLVSGCKKRGITIDLTYEDFLKFTAQPECHYCGAPLLWMEFRSKKRGMNGGHNLDRKDCLLGYSIQNCVACCPRCNWSKGTCFTYEEWKRIGEIIRTFERKPQISPQAYRSPFVKYRNPVNVSEQSARDTIYDLQTL